MPVEAPTVTLAGRTVKLQRPRAIFAIALLRTEADRATDGPEVGQALGAAALRMCWPEQTKWPGVALPLAWQVGQRAEQYGGIVYDDLAEAGIGWEEIMAAVGIAYRYAIAARVTSKEVEQAEDFSEPPEGGQ